MSRALALALVLLAAPAFAEDSFLLQSPVPLRFAPQVVSSEPVRGPGTVFGSAALAVAGGLFVVPGASLALVAGGLTLTGGFDDDATAVFAAGASAVLIGATLEYLAVKVWNSPWSQLGEQHLARQNRDPEFLRTWM